MNKKNPKISIIVPIYNAERYLAVCLESIQLQSFEDFEVICVDDGSTDSSLSILETFASKDTRFSVVSQNNQGVHMARSNGYKKARGSYLVFVDNDDFLDSDMLEKLYNTAISNRSDLVICNYRLYPKRAKNKVIWYKPYRGRNDWKFIGGNTVPWNKAFRKTLLDKAKIDELFEVMGEGAFGIILALAKRISTIDEPLYNYRVGHASVSGDYSKIDTYKKVVEGNRQKCIYAKEHDMDLELQGSFKYGYLYYCLILMSVAARNGDKRVWMETKKILKDERFFSEIYHKYCPLSLPRRIFLHFCVYPNYFVASMVSKIVLR